MELQDFKNWIDAEISIIHITLYVILLILVDGWWDYLILLFIGLSVWHIFLSLKKIKNKELFK